MKKHFLAVFFISLFLLSCSTELIKNLIDVPQVKGIELKSFSAQNKSIVFAVKLYNPNAFTLPISGLSGDIRLNQRVIGSLVAETEKSLAAYSTQTIMFPIKLDTNSLVEAAKRVLTNGEARYSFNGDLKTTVGAIPFTKTGNLSVQEIISTLVN